MGQYYREPIAVAEWSAAASLLGSWVRIQLRTSSLVFVALAAATATS